MSSILSGVSDLFAGMADVERPADTVPDAADIGAIGSTAALGGASVAGGLFEAGTAIGSSLLDAAAPIGLGALGIVGGWLMPSSLGADDGFPGGYVRPMPGPTAPWATTLPAAWNGPTTMVTPGEVLGGPVATITPRFDGDGRQELLEHPALEGPAPDSFIYRSDPRDDWPVLARLGWDEIGPRLGQPGGNKTVFEFGSDEAIGISHVYPRDDEELPYGLVRMTDELSGLSTLREHGIPTVEARGPVVVGTDPSFAALIYGERYALGSKDIAVRGIGLGARDYHNSPFLNGSTLDALLGLREALDRETLAVGDFQVLIGHGGDAVVADPGAVLDSWTLETEPARWFRVKDLADRRLDGLLEATRRSISEFGAW